MRKRSIFVHCLDVEIDWHLRFALTLGVPALLLGAIFAVAHVFARGIAGQSIAADADDATTSGGMQHLSKTASY